MELSKLDTQFLKKERWIVAVAKEHPLAERESVTLKDISEEPLFIPSRSSLFEEISQWFLANMGQPFVIGTYNQVASVLPLIAKNMGVCICPESVEQYADHDKISYLHLQNHDYISRLYMMKLKNKMLPAAARLFWDFMCTSEIKNLIR